MAVALTLQQRIAHAQGFFPDRKVIRQASTRNAHELLAAMTDADNAATELPARAVVEHLAAPASWSTEHFRDRTNRSLVLLGLNVWLSGQGYCWDQSIEQHHQWVDARYTRPVMSQRFAASGLYAFVVINIMTGPIATKPVAEWKWTVPKSFPINDADRYCLLIPMMQAIWVKGDIDGDLLNITWLRQYENQNLKAWFKNIQNKVKKFGIYSTEWVAEQCRVNPQQDLVIPPNNMVQGVSVEVARVLAYLRPDFIFPPRDSMWYCSQEDRAQITRRILYHPTRQQTLLDAEGNPVLDANGNPQMVRVQLPRFIL